jgi:hypothetical protein
MTAREIHHFLIHDQPVSLNAVEQALEGSDLLAEQLDTDHGYYVCAGRAALIPLRMKREEASDMLWPLALRYGAWLARLPFVRMVALTGALAMRNAADNDDDLDYLLVTSPRRVWLARAFSIVLVRVVKLRGVVICPNYVLSESALAQDRHDLFIAHEVTQMIPLYGQPLYEQIRRANTWVVNQLPNATRAFRHEQESSDGRFWRLLKQGVEALLGGRVGDALERWEHGRKLRRFAPEMQTPHSAAQLDDERVKGHFNDHGYRVLQAYQERLREYGLVDGAIPVSGD